MRLLTCKAGQVEPTAAKDSSGGVTSSLLQTPTRPPPHCTVLCLLTHQLAPQAWHLLRGAHGAVGILPTYSAHGQLPLPSHVTLCLRPSSELVQNEYVQKDDGEGRGREREKEQDCYPGSRVLLVRAEEQRGGKFTGNPGKESQRLDHH